MNDPIVTDRRELASTATGSIDADPVVHTEPLFAGGTLPLVVSSRDTAVTLDRFTEWLTAHRAFIERAVLTHGALLFRGFPVHSLTDFEAVTKAASDQLIEYSERSSPRSQVGDKVYTSTDYPASRRIFPHNEHSYALTYPLHLFFGCLEPATRGGETPLVNIRNVTNRISPQTRERFRTRGWMWVRHFGDGMGLSWQTTFQTHDKAAVEAYCRRSKIDAEWLEGDRLRTRQVRPVFGTHPRTGETLWFNHLTFFHISTLDRELRDVLLADLPEDELPNNTYYGDGARIEPEIMDELRAAYERETITFSWLRGDVLLLDNMLTAHARASYAGPRRVLVAMADPVTRTDF
jgi:alpha-ketoglutarate-dependent taurine dioxygenase